MDLLSSCISICMLLFILLDPTSSVVTCRLGHTICHHAGVGEEDLSGYDAEVVDASARLQEAIRQVRRCSPFRA